MNTEPVRYAYAIPGQISQSIYYQKPETPPPNHVLMDAERPLEGYYIAQADGTWKQIIDNTIYLNNGQARIERIKQQKARQAQQELLQYKHIVDQLITQQKRA